MSVDIKELATNLFIDKKSMFVVQDISVNVSIEYLEDFDESNDIYFYVNMSKITNAGVYDTDVNSRLPDYVEMVHFSPKSLKINVMEKIAAKQTNKIENQEE